MFPGSPTDESAFVRQMVDSVNCRPHCITPTPEQFLADLDRFLWINDEPVGSMAQYAGYALARLTREAQVPVTLNGQGGDEVLGGYWQSYFLHLRRLLRIGPLAAAGRSFRWLDLPLGQSPIARAAPAMLRRYRSRRGKPNRSPIGGERNGSARAKLARMIAMNDQQRRVFEIREMFLPRLLKWDDRNFMAFSVEGRYPLLDHKLIELSLTFRPEALYNSGWTKTPLRGPWKDSCRIQCFGGGRNSVLKRRKTRGSAGRYGPCLSDGCPTIHPFWNTLVARRHGA